MKTHLHCKSLIVFILCLLFSGCKTPVPNTSYIAPITTIESNHSNSDYDCILNGTLTKEERRNISHFKIAKKVKLISFSTKVTRGVPLDRNFLEAEYIKEEVTLTDDQIDALTEILYNHNFMVGVNGSIHGGCYEPRHAILFLNSSDRVFGYFEMCFTCQNYQTMPAGENMGEFCYTKYDLLKNFFYSSGIRFFQEVSEE